MHDAPESHDMAEYRKLPTVTGQSRISHPKALVRNSAVSRGTSDRQNENFSCSLLENTWGLRLQLIHAYRYLEESDKFSLRRQSNDVRSIQSYLLYSDRL